MKNFRYGMANDKFIIHKCVKVVLKGYGRRNKENIRIKYTINPYTMQSLFILFAEQEQQHNTHLLCSTRKKDEQKDTSNVCILKCGRRREEGKATLKQTTSENFRRNGQSRAHNGSPHAHKHTQTQNKAK